MNSPHQASVVVSIANSQHIVNQALASFLDARLDASSQIHPSYQHLHSEIKRVVFAGGKRLRPHMIFAAYGSYDDKIAKVAAAHELLHVALLVHDDIIDRDDLRHGQPTIHHSYHRDYYSQAIADDQERHHFSTSAALLAGDLLISSAYELIRQADLSPSQHEAASRLLSTAIFEVAGGELLDTEAAFMPGLNDPLLVYRYKTTSYSFIAPLLTGAELSGRLSPQDITLLRDYATNLGIAYQIKDDYLGVFGDSNKTGKSTLGDLREGKQTALIAEFKKCATSDQLALLERFFGNPAASVEQLNELKSALQESGALANTDQLKKNYAKRALDAANQIQNTELQKGLVDITNYLSGRDR